VNQIGPETEDEDISLLRDVEAPELSELRDPATVVELVEVAMRELIGDLLARLPLILVALLVLLLSLALVRLGVRLVDRGMEHGNVDFTVRRLVVNLLRLGLLLIVFLLALAIAGVEIGAVLAALGLVGLGLALALQNVLENIISGVLILQRKPFDRGEVILTNGYEGFVEDIDLRVTTIRAYDGTTTLIPNADVLTEPLTNFTRRGTRRSAVTIGIDYRDDHEAAREILLEAASRAEGVLEEPPPAVLMMQLGDSSVDFEVRFWSEADLRIVVQTRDAVLRACKAAVEDAGMTIPWPIRTLAADKHPLRVEDVGAVSES
jgi:small conductance mechanosensitive channel